MFHYSKSKNVDFAKLLKLAEHAYGEIPAVKKRKQSRLVFRILKYISFALIGILCLALIFAAINFFNLKISYQEALNGKENIEFALALLKEKKYAEAEEFSILANKNFDRSLASLEKIKNNIVLRNLAFINSQFEDLDNLLSAAKLISESAASACGLAVSLEETIGDGQNFAALSTEQKINFLSILYGSEASLIAIRDNFKFGYENINSAKDGILLLPLKSRLSAIEKRLRESVEFLDRAAPLAKLLPGLFGFPEKSSYLVLLQNSDELRPTGGFIGTYGIFEFLNGDILRHDTHDVYHMDMPVKDKFKIEPPPELKKYLGVDNWYLRDSNWSPHWPIAAAKAEWFFYEEDKLLPAKDQINNFDGKFDGVIGITPQLVEDLLKIIGPVEIEGIAYTSENFTDLLEYRVEKGYVELGISSWQRKEVIGEIVNEIKNRLFNLEPASLYSASNIVFDNLEKKNILINLRAPELAAIIKAQGWGGEVIENSGDYLMVVDANLAAYKTDAVISRNINYRLDQDVNGLFAELQINYKHNGEGFDWRTTRYRTYTRVYVPLDSQLISAEGLSEGEMAVHNELGKTVFGGFLSIEPGKIGSLRIKYKLPQALSEKAKSGDYELLVQKQPGNNIEALNVGLSFNKNIKAYSPTGFFANRSGDTIKWESGLTADSKYAVQLGY